MNQIDRFESLLADALDDLAVPRYPDYFDDVLATSLHRRQRPAWTFLERWIPMSTAVRRSVLGPIIPYRRIAILLAVLALMLAAGAVALIGSRPPLTPAPPFGPAENGLVTYAVNGDIFLRDIQGGAARLIVGGDDFDVGPMFSRDGTQMVFGRLTGNPLDPADPVTQESLYVANADGSSPRLLISADVGYGASWSPDGMQMAVIASDDNQMALKIVDVSDGSARTLSLPVVPLDGLEWRPPDGRELIFHGRELYKYGIYAVHPDGTGLRQLSESSSSKTFWASGMGYAISPDGQTLLYTAGLDTVQIHQLDLDTSEDTVWGTALPALPGSNWGFPVFSPDGSEIVFGRYWDQQGTLINHQVFLATLASDGADAVPLSEILRSRAGEIPFDYGFSPDGRRVIVRYFDTDKTLLIDPATGESEALAWGTVTEYPSWQRRSPPN